MPDRAQFRDTHHYLAAVASELARPALRAYARARAPAAPSPPQTWRRGVILGASHIGDVLYRTCSLAPLHVGLPECRWTYVATGAGAELLRDNPALSDVLAVDDRDPTLVERLRARDFDVALCTDNIQHHRALLAATRAGIPNRVALASKGLSGLATLPVRVTRESWPAQFRTMVRALAPGVAFGPLRPQVFRSDDDRAAAATAWNALPYGDAPLTIAVSVTTRQEIGVFPPELFASVLTRACALEPELRVLLTGSEDDRPMLESIAARVGGRSVVVAGALRVRSFVALLERCDAFLGSDSGPRHMANAAGIPVFFVRNMAVPEIEAGRYCETETDIAPPGQYLSAAENADALRGVDIERVARTLLGAARAHRSALR